jgi:hypothetical protein
MATFELNTRHEINVGLNGQTGLCDVVVTDKVTNNSFIKSLMLGQYNKLVDYFKANDHAFAIQAANNMF